MARKILSGTLIGLSSILFILSIIGFVMLWVYKAPLTDRAMSQLRQIDTEMAQAQTALKDAKTEIERTQRIVESAEKSFSSLKDELAQAKNLFGDANGTLDNQLIPALKASRSQIDQVKRSLADLRASMDRLNAIPFLNLNLPGDQVLANLINLADSTDAQIAKAEDLVKKASTFVNDASYLMGGDFTETKQHLQNFLDVVVAYDQKITGWRAQVEMLIGSLPGWINAASIILTIFLLWFAFSQAGLFLHGLTLWRGGDPLDVARETWMDFRSKGDEPEI
jgi:vacuolar-type H+-ATPase subunit D/Vma8